MRFFVRIAVFTLLLSAMLWAQASTSQISGSVLDSTGAAIPGAAVRVSQTDTGLVRTATTTSEGSYVLPNLPIGPYRMEASKEGFSTFVQSGIVLEVSTNPTKPRQRFHPYWQ